MHILHLIARYHPAHGGAENYIAEISARLVAKGHQVTVVTSDALDVELFWQSGLRRVSELEGEIEGVRIIRFPIHYLPLMYYAYPALRRLLWIASYLSFVPNQLAFQLARYTPWLPELWPWLAQNQMSFDIVASVNTCFEPMLEAGLLLARQQKIPFVTYPLTHLGAGDAPGQDSLSRFYTMRHQIALIQQSNGIIAQTLTEKRFYQERGVPSEHIWPIGPGINLSDYHGGDGTAFRQCYQINGPLVISLSQMTYDKGTIHTVEAIRQLWKAGRQVELALAGAILEPFARYLEQLPSDERERIRLLGFISNKERSDMLAAGNILAMPSRTESFGIVYLEAWLHGIPVIGAKTWGVNDVISDGEDGLLVPFGDVTELAQAITYFLDNPDRATIMGKRGRLKVQQHHTWDHKIDSIEEVYAELISRHRP